MLIRKTTDRDFIGIGIKIKKAREADPRSLTAICAATNMCTANWYRIESENITALPLETLRKIEAVLNTSFGVVINDEHEV